MLRRLPMAVIAVFVMSLCTASISAQTQDKGVQVELVRPDIPNQSQPPRILTFADAIEQAQRVDAYFQSAVTDAKLAHEDRTQARNAVLPTMSYTSQALLTQGNNGRTSIGRFVTEDGVHVYRSWGVLHEDLGPSKYFGTTYRQARAAAAIASAKAEIAKGGLNATVTKLYYGVAVAQRKYAMAQMASDTAKHFYDITQDAERRGDAQHIDVLQAEIQYRQQDQAFQEANLAMESARMDLAVLLFPTLNENFSIVDDLDNLMGLPKFEEAQKMAASKNPDLQVAVQTLYQSKVAVETAKAAFLPAFYTDSVYGIEANAYALHSRSGEETRVGVLPNLGYFMTVAVNVPVWDWGTLRSKLHQAQFKHEQAGVELSQRQRELLSTLYSTYDEAVVAKGAVDQTRHMADLAAESLRLTNLRYNAGASTALEVVVAENALTQARNSYSDAQLRYRVAVANLQTVTGKF